MKKSKSLKISKGYRLKESTHHLIKNLQAITSMTSDQVLRKSCMLYYKTLLEKNGIEKGKY